MKKIKGFSLLKRSILVNSVPQENNEILSCINRSRVSRSREVLPSLNLPESTHFYVQFQTLRKDINKKGKNIDGDKEGINLGVIQI